MPCPILPLVGNHDTREGLLHAFPDCGRADGFVHYAIERDGLVSLCLDTLEPGRHGGGFYQQRRDWLAARLAETGERPVAIFMHHPPGLPGTSTGSLGSTAATSTGPCRHVSGASP